jgi:hypothetical protein
MRWGLPGGTGGSKLSAALVAGETPGSGFVNTLTGKESEGGPLVADAAAGGMTVRGARGGVPSASDRWKPDVNTEPELERERS